MVYYIENSYFWGLFGELRRVVAGREDEVLYAANSDEDAQKVHGLIKGNKMITIKSGHDIHFEKPDEFIKIMTDFLNNIKSGR